VFWLKSQTLLLSTRFAFCVCYVPKQRVRIVLSFYIVGKVKIISMSSKLCVATRSVKFWARRTVGIWCPFKISSNSLVFKNLYQLNCVSYDLWVCHAAQIITTHSKTLPTTRDFTICSLQWVFSVYQWIAVTL